VGALVTSCATVSNTATTAPVSNSVEQYPTVANLDVDSQKVEKTVTWNWTPFGSLYSFEQRRQNLTADLLKEKNADVLVEPQYTYTKHSFGPRTLTIYGFPAHLKNFRKATPDDVSAIGLVNGLPYQAPQQPQKHGFLGMKGNKQAHETAARTSKPAPQYKPWQHSFSYVRIGMDKVNVDGEDNYGEDPDPRYGIELDYGHRTYFGSSKFFYAFELGFNMQGCKNYYDNSETYGSSRSVKKKIGNTCLHVDPVNIGVSFNIGSQFRIDLHGGGYVSYAIVDKRTEKQSYGDDGTYSHVLRDFPDADCFDAGYTFGGGVWFRNFNFDVTARKGLRTVKGTVDNHANNLAFTLGIAL
jgi:hypothetical protein